MDTLVGQSLGRYQVISLLGEGGMGEVYRGLDPLLNRDVAIKLMHPHFSRQPNFRDRFLLEARTAAHLDHPGVVKVYDSGEVNGALFIVMEFIPGSNLRKILDDLRENRRWIVRSEAVGLVQQVCLAMDYVHRQGVLHRDLKPDNIMLKPEPAEDLPYHPVITDLGLAKLLEGLPITQEGTSLGTPSYMSPEQAMGLPLDERSDVYSLGILLFELSAGKLPFPARTLSEAIRFHTKEPPPPPHTIVPDFPASLENVILKALAKDPAGRYQSARDLAQALENLSVVELPGETLPEQPATLVSLAAANTQVDQTQVDEQTIVETPAEKTDKVLRPQDFIRVIYVDGTSRLLPIKPEGITIGRDKDNDIVLEDKKASRHHVKIERKGESYLVTDLNSTNGTFLENARLTAEIPAIWQTDQALTIGDICMKLEIKSASVPPTQVDFGSTLVSERTIQPVHLPETPQITVHSLSFWKGCMVWLFLSLGWGFSVNISDAIFNGFLGGHPVVSDWFIRSGIVPIVSAGIAWAIYGCIYGTLVGAVTSLSAHWIRPSFNFGHSLILIIGWLIGWAFYLPGHFNIYPFPVNPPLYGVITGAIGGLFTSLAVWKTKPSLGCGMMFLVGLGFFIGQLVVYYLKILDAINFGYFYEMYKLDLTGFIAAAIAGVFMILILGLSTNKATGVD
jgi:serine/threonine protein kinase